MTNAVQAIISAVLTEPSDGAVARSGVRALWSCCYSSDGLLVDPQQAGWMDLLLSPTLHGEDVTVLMSLLVAGCGVFPKLSRCRVLHGYRILAAISAIGVTLPLCLLPVRSVLHALWENGEAARVLRMSRSPAALLRGFTFYDRVLLSHQPQRLLTLCDAYGLRMTKLQLGNHKEGFDERLLPFTAADERAVEKEEKDAPESLSAALWYSSTGPTPPFLGIQAIVGWTESAIVLGAALRRCRLSSSVQHAPPQPQSPRAFQLEAR